MNKIIKTKDSTLICDDAYQFINKLKQDKIKVNHIITDPPYNISQKNSFNTLHGHRQGIDFGKWDKNFDLFGWIKLYKSMLNRGGSLITFASWRYLSYIADYLEENKFKIKDLLKWIKTNPMPRNINRRYVVDTEFAIWAVKPGKKWIFNKPKNVGYLRPEFHTPVVSGKEKTGHPTQKSLKLMKQIIKIHTNKNQIVLDPFMGSGTTGIACQQLHRKFIGIEINPKYFQMAVKRFKNNK